MCVLSLLTAVVLQMSQAVQILVEAVSAANSGDEVALLQQAMANVCIRKGLEPHTISGYQLQSRYQLQTVHLTQFGQDAAFRSVKSTTKFATKKLKTLMNSKNITAFTMTGKFQSDEVFMDITKLIPNPSAEVRSLLPTVTWPEPAGSGSSSAEFLSPYKNHETSAFLKAQPATDQQLDPVFSMLDLLPSEVTTSIKQQLGLEPYAYAHYSISR